MPTLHVLAGPNGAGKSTLYEAVIKSHHPSVEFVNADLLAAAHFGHNATTDDETRKGQELADARRAALMAAGTSLITETTFSHPSKLMLLQEARALGYKIAVYHVNVRSPDVCVARVRSRVAYGGHDVPEDRIRGRYERNKELIKEAVLTADRGLVFDNSQLGKPPDLALKFERGQLTYASEHVPAWAQTLYAEQLERLSAARLNPAAASFAEARAITQKMLGEDAKTYVARQAGTYRGEIIARTSEHTLQRLSSKSIVAHFTDRLQTLPTLNSHATIAYAKEQAKAVVHERLARAVAFETQPETDALKRFPELKAAYDAMRSLEAENLAAHKITEATAPRFRAILKERMTAAIDAGQLPAKIEKVVKPPDRKTPDLDR